MMSSAIRRPLLACFPGRALGPSDAIETISHPLAGHSDSRLPVPHTHRPK